MTAEIRTAEPEDAQAVASVWLRSFAAALPLVKRAHTDDQVRAWIRDILLPTQQVWVVQAAGEIVGMMAMREHWIDQLYLAPDWRGQGLGDRLIALAKDVSPLKLELWTFQVNQPARRFYIRHGFEEVEATDGAGNEEKEPDVRLLWSGGQAARRLGG